MKTNKVMIAVQAIWDDVEGKWMGLKVCTEHPEVHAMGQLAEPTNLQGGDIRPGCTIQWLFSERVDASSWATTLMTQGYVVFINSLRISPKLLVEVAEAIPLPEKVLKAPRNGIFHPTLVYHMMSLTMSEIHVLRTKGKDDFLQSCRTVMQSLAKVYNG